MTERKRGFPPFTTATLLPTLLGVFAPVWIAVVGIYAIENIPIAVDYELRDEFDQKLADHDAEIVVLGNSITAKGVNEEQLERLLGRKVTLLTIPSSEAPGWYATLKNRVYAQGYRPDAIVVVNGVESMLSVDASSSKDMLFLEQMMASDEPVLGQKVLYKESGNQRWSNLTRRRSLVRRAVLDGWRDGVGTWVAGSDTRLVAASNGVFADNKIDYGLSSVKAPEEMRRRVMVAPRESLLPDLLDLTEENDGRFFFALVPVAPGAAHPEAADVLRDTVTLLNQRDAGFVGLDIQLSAVEFQDVMHLNPSGQFKFTQYLAAKLIALGINGSEPIPKASVPYSQPSVSRIGELSSTLSLTRTPTATGSCAYELPLDAFTGVVPDVITAAGLPGTKPWELWVDGVPMSFVRLSRSLLRDCVPGTYGVRRSQILVVPPEGVTEGFQATFQMEAGVTLAGVGRGEVTWIYPGTSLAIESTEPWSDARGPMAVMVLAHPFGGGNGVPTVQINQQLPVAMDDFGAMRVGKLPSPKNNSKWRVVVHSPDDGPFLAIHGVSLGRDDSEISFLNTGRSTKLLAFNIVGRNHKSTEMEHLFYPPVVPGRPRVEWNDEGMGVYDVPHLQALSDGRTNRVSPLAVLEDGEPLERHLKCDEVAIRPGTQCHTNRGIKFHPTNGRGQHEYALVFDRTPNPDRKRQFWVLPGDHLQVKFGQNDLALFAEGPQDLEVAAEAYPISEATGRLQIVLKQADKVLYMARYSPHELHKGVRVVLDGRVSPATSTFTLQIVNKSGVPMLFQKVTLIEHVGQRHESHVAEGVQP